MKHSHIVVTVVVLLSRQLRWTEGTVRKWLVMSMAILAMAHVARRAAPAASPWLRIGAFAVWGLGGYSAYRNDRERKP